MAKNKKIKAATEVETVVYNGFRFSNDLYIRFSFNTATNELTAAAETSEGELSGTVTLSAEAEPAADKAEAETK